MKKLTTILLFHVLCLNILAQQKDFEGILVYKVDIKSKNEGMSEKAWKNIMGYGDSLVVTIKKGNYKRSSAMADEYHIAAKQKAYIKFKTIDTLYYIDFGSDTSSVIKVAKTGEKKIIAGVECNSLVMETKTYKRKYFYAPSLYINPAYNKDNKLGRYDVYAKETESIWLASSEETTAYSLSHNCVKLQQTQIGDAAFDLPNLPEKKFTIEAIIIPPKFSRSMGWIKYLQANINSGLGAKYIKIPKKEELAAQTVIVGFVINEKGMVTKAEVINKKEVHTKLAEEALRVINESGVWQPATVFGEKMPFWLHQPITFQASK